MASLDTGALINSIKDVASGVVQQDVTTISGFAPNDIVARPGILHRAMGAYHEAIAPTLFLKSAYEQNSFPAPIRISHFGIEIDRALKPARPIAEKVRRAHSSFRCRPHTLRPSPAPRAGAGNAGAPGLVLRRRLRAGGRV